MRLQGCACPSRVSPTGPLSSSPLPSPVSEAVAPGAQPSAYSSRAPAFDHGAQSHDRMQPPTQMLRWEERGVRPMVSTGWPGVAGTLAQGRRGTGGRAGPQ